MNKKLIFGILATLVIGLFVVEMYSADIVRGEEKIAVESNPASAPAPSTPEALEALFLRQLPEELRNQVLEMKRTMSPLEALMMRAREMKSE